ncbi:hypothetical protein CathTA2_0624 [Caldalkalibacillus thermarum TA2.A1]|uniref:Lipoprotein n=2 Tax=Caldalkalibacillus thermarum (strain TA2.A1) TaxID=986075 RepID=F5L4B2_CALTT|nr:hypothetical protein [Caldalkalibacillus thermarum]EGL83830.1 hypothetical protein CathTA2_0624 [Caldalkalibacillus thermarum TA2.A1]QZT34515.1 hypothetical protein HUR95_03830 [Caldalkalibacillus thermarum TA2.A1]
MRLAKYVLLLAVVIVIQGCQSAAHQSVSQETPHMLGFGISLGDERFIDDWRFTLEMMEDRFKPDALLVENFHPDKQPYRLHFFLNYEPYPVIYNGEKHTYIDVEVPGNTTVDVPIEVPGLSEGVHELLIVLNRKPDRYVESDEFIPPGETTLTRLARLHVGKKTETDVSSHISYEMVQVEEAEPLHMIFLSEEPLTAFDGEKLITAITEPEQLDNLWLHFPVYQPGQTFALMVLQDTEMITQTYLKAENTGVAHYPLNLELTQPENPSNLIILLAGNPFQVPGTDEEMYEGRMVYVNNRITVHIE